MPSCCRRKRKQRVKAKISVRGIDIELDGTSDEIAAVVRAAANAAPQLPFVPYLQNPMPLTSAIYTGHVCEYPSPWNAVVPPSCKVCGVQAASWTIVVDNDQAQAPVFVGGHTIVSGT